MYCTFLLPGSSVAFHSPPQKGVLSCPECNAAFSSMRYLIEHRRVEHRSVYVAFCDACGKGFKSPSGYHIHKKMFHSAECNYPMCKICGKKFASSSRLLVHLRSHSDQRNFFCSKCGKSFKYEGCLKKHGDTCK